MDHNPPCPSFTHFWNIFCNLTSCHLNVHWRIPTTPIHDAEITVNLNLPWTECQSFESVFKHIMVVLPSQQECLIYLVKSSFPSLCILNPLTTPDNLHVVCDGGDRICELACKYCSIGDSSYKWCKCVFLGCGLLFSFFFCFVSPRGAKSTAISNAQICQFSLPYISESYILFAMYLHLLVTQISPHGRSLT